MINSINKSGYLYLVAACMCYAAAGVLTKALRAELGPFVQAFLWLSVSTAIAWVVVRYRRRPLRLARPGDWRILVPMGVIGYGLQASWFTLSLYYNTLGNTLFIFSAYPLLVLVPAYFILKEDLGKRQIISMILMVCVLFLLFEPRNLQASWQGNLYALLACGAFTVYIIGSRVLARHGNLPDVIMLWSVALAAATSGALALTLDYFPATISWQTMVLVAMFGALSYTAYSLVNRGLALVPAGAAAMILLLEPVFGTLVGLLIFGEAISLHFVLGAVIMMTAIYVANFKLD